MIQDLIRQKELLRKEYEFEKEQFQRQTQNMGVQKKVRRGLCWYPLSVGRSYYNSLEQLVVEVSRYTDLDIEHQFEPGKPVCFFQEDASGMLSYMKFNAQVSFVEENRMVIALPSKDALLQLTNAERLGVQIYLDEYTYRLMFQALDTVIEAREGRLAQLRDICHTYAKASEFSFAPVRFPWLNPSQEKAANLVLRAKDVAVVHGPPGTGKTTTLVETIYETLRRESQVMVCAQSNMAVDWISEKLTERGVNVLRIGNPTRVTDKMLQDTYERRFESHPLYDQLWGIRRNIRQIYEYREGNRESRHQKIARLKERAAELEYRINEELFDDARVIACTLTGSAHHLLTGRRFPTLFIDEAAQALEAACWIAIQKADRVVLAGDHRQLPPTIKSPAAMSGGLDKTLMQTICEKQPKCVSMLNVQYRMADDIMQFPNREFYDGCLYSDPSVKYRGILDWDTPIEWIEAEEGEGVERKTENGKRKSENGLAKLDEPWRIKGKTENGLAKLDEPWRIKGKSENGLAKLDEPWRIKGKTKKSEYYDYSDYPDYSEQTAADGLSRINPAEAQLALQTLHDYLERIGRDRILYERLDIGIISPYKGQVHLLRQMMRKDSYWKPFRQLISINTVDGFQGQERDIILISMVRNNAEGQVGFLADLRRMNVAITRARMKLLIIGHSPTLCRHPFYRRLKQYTALCTTINIISSPSPPSETIIHNTSTIKSGKKTMNFKELCEARYSCRKYQDRPIEAEKLDYIRECVRLAPSAVNRQPWRFILVDNSQPELFANVKATYHRDWINDVPAIILCMKAESECWTRRYDSKSHADIDLAIAIEHLCLAATEQGLGTCWVCNFDINQFHEIVPMEEGLEPVALIPIGYPADELAPKVRKAMEEVWK